MATDAVDHAAELAQYASPEFHSRLQKDWPEDAEQLHSGGWDMTRKLGAELEAFLGSMGVKADDARLLDLCCGEGSTPVHFAKERGWNSVGIDISPSAIATAQEAAAAAGVGALATFVVGSAFELPFETGSFDVVYGQDPDAFSMSRRPASFAESLRTLKPGGLMTFHHHWVPGRGWSAEDLARYRAETGSGEPCGDAYVSDLLAAGFEVTKVEDISELASSHLHGQLDKMQARVAASEGKEQTQDWLVSTVRYIDEGFPFGIRVAARKPGGAKPACSLL